LALQERNIKEVIGLAHFNEASVYWSQNQYEKALNSYRKALPYLPNDKLLAELMGYNLLFTGQEQEGRKLLESLQGFQSPFALYKEGIYEDYLKGNVDSEGIKAIFLHVDETRDSILKKKEKLQETVKKFPHFKAGVFSLAVAWLQLHRYGEGLEELKRYHALEKNDPTAEYYLAMLYLERFDYNAAWEHFLRLEKILISKNHHPKLLRDLRRELLSLTSSPDTGG
jgi:tetratricopeptide (TPR) repeat protein